MLGAIIGDLAGSVYEYDEFTDKNINLKRRLSIFDKEKLIDNNSFYTFAPPLTDFEVRAYIVLLTGIGAIIWGVIEIADKDNK